MSKFTTAAAITAALITVSLPADAHNGLSKKQVRNIVKQEIAKAGRLGAPGPAGSAGPQGPAGPRGMDGMPFLFAHVSGDGIVDDR